MVSFNTEVVIFFGTEINYLLSLKLSSLETCSVYLDSLCIESAVNMMLSVSVMPKIASKN